MGRARKADGDDGGKAEGAADAQLAVADLATTSLEALKAAHPDEWARVGQALVTAVERERAAGAARFLARARAEAAPWRARLAKSGQNPRVFATARPVLVRERMAELAVKEVVDGVAAVRAGGTTGTLPAPKTLRFGLVSGLVVQRLLFRRALERKPVSSFWFRLLWPLVPDKALLMPLVEPKGIYCFYSRALVHGLARLCGEVSAGEPPLEIAAGDGTLARFLRAGGCPVRACDDQSWRVWDRSAAFPADVERVDAETALARYAPKVVICSWPPPSNRFERAVFRCPSVRRYVVLTTRHRFAAGDWSAYDSADGFTRRVDERLSPLILPPEIDPVLLVFDRSKPLERP